MHDTATESRHCGGFFLALYSAQGKSNESAQIEVVVISSLHGLHSSNPNYSYDDLYDAIPPTNPITLGWKFGLRTSSSQALG